MMTKVVKFFVYENGVKGDEIQALMLSDKMSITDIQTSFRTVALAKPSDVVLLYAPLPELQNTTTEQVLPSIPFHFSVLDDKVEYRLVVTSKEIGASISTLTLDLNNNFHLNTEVNHHYSVNKIKHLLPYLAKHNDRCLTVFSRRYLCTYHHGSHSTWRVGDTINNVNLHDGSMISCNVVCVNSVSDYIILQPLQELPDSIKDQHHQSPHIGQQVMTLDLSGRNQTTAIIPLDRVPKDNCHVFTSLDIGNVACELLDKCLFMKTNKKPARGESGAPIFDYLSGHLVGMMTASEHERVTLAGCYGGKGCFISSLTLAGICGFLEMQEKISNNESNNE